MPNAVRQLRYSEKEAIRNSPCGQCEAIPILENGERCHPHRIVHGADGGQYTEDNVVPRCYSCHDVEHGGDGTAPFLGACREGGLNRMAKLSSAERSAYTRRIRAQRDPERLRERASNICRNMTPSQLKERSRKSTASLLSNSTPEERSARSQKGGLTGKKHFYDTGCARKAGQKSGQQYVARTTAKERHALAIVGAKACIEKYSVAERRERFRKASSSKARRRTSQGARSWWADMSVAERRLFLERRREKQWGKRKVL